MELSDGLVNESWTARPDVERRPRVERGIEVRVTVRQNALELLLVLAALELLELTDVAIVLWPIEQLANGAPELSRPSCLANRCILRQRRTDLKLRSTSGGISFATGLVSTVDCLATVCQARPRAAFIAHWHAPKLIRSRRRVILKLSRLLRKV